MGIWCRFLYADGESNGICWGEINRRQSGEYKKKCLLFGM